jgi:glycosyltransferase involved in cell wall biosynthesis
MDDIVECREQGLVVLSPVHRRPFRRVLYVNSYGGVEIFNQIKSGFKPSHHLWGCLQLVRLGYEVALAEPLTDFYLYRNPFPHDLKQLKMVRSWLGRDGIVYCGHNVLYWIPFLRALGAIRPKIVSLLFAREPLAFSGAHSGLVALNPTAAAHARKLAPKARVAHLGWGADLNAFPALPYHPDWFLSCGITQRDHGTLCEAASRCRAPIQIISPNIPSNLAWPPNVRLVTGGRHDDTVSYHELLQDHYARCAGSLIILKNDPAEHTAVGFTNLLEAMAMARPVIVTRTGALASEIDIDAAGCGLSVPAENPLALANAIETLARDPVRAEAMGAKGRNLAENHYNIDRYAAQLHDFFQLL